MRPNDAIGNTGYRKAHDLSGVDAVMYVRVEYPQSVVQRSVPTTSRSLRALRAAASTLARTSPSMRSSPYPLLLMLLTD